MEALRAANLALKFLLELAAFVAFAVWGAHVGSGALSVVVAIVAPAVAIALWAVFAAPRSERRLPRPRRLAFELAVFALAALAFLGAGSIALAVALAVLAAANTVLLIALGDLDM